jgi:PAS domain S-box-containing protein
VLVAFSKQCRAFSDEDVSFVQATANVLGAAIDRKQSEDELHRREHEFKVLVEHAADNIVRLDHDLRFMYVNPAAESLMGIPASQLVGQTNRDLALRLDLPQSLLLTWDRALRRVLRTGEEEVLELAYPVNNGERYFAVKLSPEFGADGAVNSVLGVGRDITGDKQRDADRAELYGELLARDVRLHELVERVLLSQRESNRRRVLRVPVTEQFSKRDREILRLLARGLTNRQIGQQLNLSAGTIKNHVASLLPRLNAVDRTQAAVRATELGLLGAESKPES